MVTSNIFSKAVSGIALTALATLLVVSPNSGHASRKKHTPDAKPITHRLIAQDRGHIVILNEKGDVEWEAPCNFTSHDISFLPNGNVLAHTGPATIVEMTKDKQIVWKHTSTPKAPYAGAVEIHGFQRLKDGNTMISETGNKRFIEVDKDDKIVKEVPFTVDHPNSHRDTRMVRKLDNGHYLACHEGDGVVREWDADGKLVWSYKMDLNNQPETPGHDGHGINVFGAVRLKNGNTLIAGGNNNRVLEVTPAGQVVWSIERDELKDTEGAPIHLCWVTTLELLPNNHLVFGNTHAGPNNPQLIEVTHDKETKVLWTLKNMTVLGNDTCAAQLLDVKGKIVR